MNLETLIVVENGDIFEGTREQFINCFFTNATNKEIQDWCFDNGYKLKIGDKIIYG
jgi:hypothetical protein